MKKVLIVDDDNQIRDVLKRTFSSQEWVIGEAADGENALKAIKSDTPNLLILDLNMPGLSGKEVLSRIRNDIRTMMMPVIVITGYESFLDKIHGLEMGADDYINKPFNINELILKANNLMQRQIFALTSNPLTGMPGAPVIEKLANDKIQKNEPFAFMYIDIDNFKAYNDAYGYLKGDMAIKRVAEILKGIYDKFPENYFAGHIGGDDFVVICPLENSEKIADYVAFNFDNSIENLYSEEDFKKGCIESVDREGKTKTFSLMSLSISIVTNEKRALTHYGKIIDIAFEIKKYLKSLKGRKGSLYLKDRRRD